MVLFVFAWILDLGFAVDLIWIKEVKQKGYEKWVAYDNVQHKRQWIDKDKSPQPTPKAELHGRKVLK